METTFEKDAKAIEVDTTDVASSKDDVVTEAVLPVSPAIVVAAVPTAPPAESSSEVATAALTEAGAGAGGLTPESVMSAFLTTGRAQPSSQTSPVVETDVANVAQQLIGSDASELDEGLTRTAAETKPAAVSAAAEIETARQPSPIPSPLRALAERTSQPLDLPANKTTDVSTSGSGAGEMKTGAATKAAASDSLKVPARSSGPADTGPQPAHAIGADELSIDAAPVGDTTTGTSSTVAQTHETSLSGLSRATIEATAQIAAQILRKLEGRSTRFEMALTPGDLGRVDVKLDIDSEGRLSARLAFDNPVAATDLRGRADELRRQLEDAGFHLAEDAFEFADRDSGSSAFDRGQDSRHGQNRAFAAASRLNAEIDVAQPPRWMTLSLSPSGVDLKV